jgi:hypothetical protein
VRGGNTARYRQLKGAAFAAPFFMPGPQGLKPRLTCLAYAALKRRSSTWS